MTRIAPLCAYAASAVLLLTLLCGSSLTQNLPAPVQREIAEGVRLLRSGETLQAIDRFNAALALAPQSPEALTWRGVCENQALQYTAAAADFRAALRTDPHMIAAHYNLALSLIRLEQTDAAIEQLRIVIAAQPDSVQPLYNLAVLLEAQGSLAEAIEHLNVAHALAPADDGVTLHLLLDSIKQNDTQRLPLLLSALAAETTAPATQRQAAAALLAAGRFAEAVPLLRSAYRREPAPGEDLLLARLLLVTDQPDEARALLANPPSNSRVDAERQALLGAALAALRQIPEAIAALLKALQADPKLALAHNILGFCLFQQGQYAQAAEAYGKASELEPQRLLYAEDAARACQRANTNTQALRFAQRATSLAGTTAADYALLGKLYAALERPDDAVRELRHAAELDPSLESAPYLLARTYMRMGDAHQAELWSAKLAALKQRHAADFDLRKKSIATPLRSSTLLQGGAIGDGETGTTP